MPGAPSSVLAPSSNVRDPLYIGLIQDALKAFDPWTLPHDLQGDTTTTSSTTSTSSSCDLSCPRCFLIPKLLYIYFWTQLAKMTLTLEDFSCSASRLVEIQTTIVETSLRKRFGSIAWRVTSRQMIQVYCAILEGCFVSLVLTFYQKPIIPWAAKAFGNRRSPIILPLI